MIDISEQRTLLMFLLTLEIYCNKQLCAIHAFWWLCLSPTLVFNKAVT